MNERVSRLETSKHSVSVWTETKRCKQFFWGWTVGFLFYGSKHETLTCHDIMSQLFILSFFFCLSVSDSHESSCKHLNNLCAYGNTLKHSEWGGVSSVCVWGGGVCCKDINLTAGASGGVSISISVTWSHDMMDFHTSALFVLTLHFLHVSFFDRSFLINNR